MVALFGNSDEYGYDEQLERGSPRLFQNSSRISLDDAYRHRSWRSQSNATYDSRRSKTYSEDDTPSSSREQHRRQHDRKQLEVLNEDASSNSKEKHHSKNRKCESRIGTSDDMNIHDSDIDSDGYNHHGHKNRSRRCKEKRNEKSHGAGLKGQWSGKDRNNVLKPSGIVAGGRQQNRELTSPDYHWVARGSAYDSNLSAGWSEGEQDGAHIYKEKSPRHYSLEEFEDKQSTRSSGHRRKPSSIRSEHEPEKHSKKSKRKRDTYEPFDSEHHERKRYHSADHRGRWEPDKDVPSELN